MRIISVLNQKGGAGKTTISTHLATALHLSGKNVLLIDGDPQGSASDWSAIRENHPIPVVQISRPTLDRDIKAISHGKDYVIIDGAPQVHDLAISAIKASDLVVIPVQPSPYDIWSTSDLVEQVKNRIEITDGKLKAVFLVNRIINRTKIGRDVKKALQAYDIPILESSTQQRVVYAESAIKGYTCFDEGLDTIASREIFKIMREIEDIFIE